MEFVENKEMVVLFDKKIGLDALASKLALLSGEQTKTFFLNREIKIPRRINSMALISALNERIKTLDSHSLTREGFIKLENYATFTEFQLQNLFEKIGTTEDFFLYRKNLWKILIRNHIGIKMQDGELIHLMNLRKTKIDSFTSYTKAIFPVTLDLVKEFDGCPLTNLEAVLKESFSLEELKLLADKYNFNIPARLKKDELLNYVKAMMKAKRKLTLAVQRELNNMTIVQLNDFCTLQGLGISSNLKKDEMVTLLLFLVKQAGFTTIDAKQIRGLSFTEPLKFRIDLDAVDNFKRGLPKKVIYLDDNEIKSFNQLDEYVEEAVEKTNSKDDLIFEVLKKLLPYLNVDAETAKLAIHQGIEMPEPKKKKTASKPVATEVSTVKKTQAKTKEVSTSDTDLLDEIIKKIRKLREKDKLEEEKAKIAKKRAILDENIDDLLAEFDDNEEFDHLDFEPVDDAPRGRSLEEVYQEIKENTPIKEPENFKHLEDNLEEITERDEPLEEKEPLETEMLSQENVEEPIEEKNLDTEGIEITEENLDTLSQETEPVIEIDEAPSLEPEPSVPEQALDTPLEETPKELLNESYDEAFLLEEGIIKGNQRYDLVPVGPLIDLTKEQVDIPDFKPLDNPYYGNKKMNFKWKPIFFTLGTFVLIFIVFISIMAVVHALK